MAASTEGEVLAGKALLLGIQAFLRLETMGPFLGSLEQVGANRKMYVSPGSTAHDDDCKTFTAKIGSALGPGNTWYMKRSAYETYDFAKDAIRLKDLAGTPDEFADLFRPFWDKDDSSSGGDMWRQTTKLRQMGATFSMLPLLQFLNLSKDKMKRVGLHQFRFTGGPAKKYVAFHVRMAELLHVLPQELQKSSELAAGQNEELNMGLVGSEDASEDEADLRRDYVLVIASLGALNRLFTSDVVAARAFTEDDLASARTSLAGAILDRGTCGAIFRVLDYGWMPHNAGFGFLDLTPSILHSNWF
jgi:hypothetical protein